MSDQDRKLAAIMFTDIVGYTALGHRNESLSLALLDDSRRLVRPIFAKHNGTEVKTVGDAILVKFSSALRAVMCAYEIQSSMREVNASLPEPRRVQLRIGIHLGDVVEIQGDVYGDSVNIASRIGPLAREGGVCVTQQVYDQVHNKFELPLSSLGKQLLKNVSTPIEVYRVVMPWEQREEVKEEPTLDRLRVAVLPLENISPDPNDDYFADGMTEELIATLSRISEIDVISRTSVIQYRRNPKPTKEVAHELKTGTILEGSVRKAGDKIRVTIQMIDAGQDKHLWAESYDRGLEDIFAIQSDISRNVAEALKVQLLADERKRLKTIPTTNMESYTLFLKGRNYLNERTREAFYKAVGYFEEAIKRDPKYASPYAGLSDSYHLLENWGYLRPQVAWTKALGYAKKALEIDNTLPEAHTSMAMSMACWSLDWKGSEREYRRALDLNPSYATARHWYAMHLLVPERRWDEAIQEIGEAAKLDPFSSIIATNEGKILFTAGRHREGIEKLRHALEINPEFAYAHASLGLSLVSMSSVDEGTAETEKALSLSPEHGWIRSVLAYVYMAAGRRADAERILLELKEMANQKYVPGTWMAGVYAVLDDKDRAFEWLGRAAEERTSSLYEGLSEAMFDGLRTDPRFNDVLQRIHLA